MVFHYIFVFMPPGLQWPFLFDRMEQIGPVRLRCHFSTRAGREIFIELR